MSAWVVSREHIDVLASAMLAERLIEPDSADATGRLLWRENLRSVASCDPDVAEEDLCGPRGFSGRDVEAYTHTSRSTDDASYLLTQLACYEYQTSKPAEWMSSEARVLCERLAEVLVGRGAVIPAADHYIRGVSIDEHGELLRTWGQWGAYERRQTSAA